MKSFSQTRSFIPDQHPALDNWGEDLGPKVDRDTARGKGRSSEAEIFVVGVAHELNNLFASIILNAEMLEVLLGRKNKRIQSLLRVAHRGTVLTEKMLSVSRLQNLNPSSLNLGILAEDMIDRLTLTLGDTIEINLSQAPNPWPVFADPIQLENAVLNMVGNAGDAMPYGGRLTIEVMNFRLEPKYADLQPNLAPGDYVVLAVGDTGCGIEPTVIEHVFEPFFTSKDASEAVGLGLFQVYGFARKSGGHVTIESELGLGTTVKIYLPRVARALAQPKLESRITSPEYG